MIRTRYSLLSRTVTVIVAITSFASPARGQLSLDLDATVGLTKLLCSDSTDLSTCAPAVDDSVTPEPADTVLIQYEVTNTGSQTLEFHDLGDSQLGSILSNFPYSLAPAASAFVQATLIAPMTPTEIIGFATWTARDNSTGETFGSDGYSIVVPEPQLTLDVKVGRAADFCSDLGDIDSCAGTPGDFAVVDPGDQLYIVYDVLNSGQSSLVIHDLVDSKLGAILTDFPFALSPAASVFVQQFDTAPIAIGIENRSATWSAEDVGGNVDSDVDPFAILVSQLPVEMISFDGTLDDGRVSLVWSTASERNNSGFAVEFRPATPSLGGESFQEIAWIEGNGTSIEQHDYEYVSPVLSPGTYEFRLKQIDFDGHFEYFGPLEVIVTVPGTSYVTGVYPNPVLQEGRLSLAVPREQSVSAVLYDVLGKPVLRLFEGSIPAETATDINFDVGALPRGVYFARVRGETFEEVRKLTVAQ